MAFKILADLTVILHLLWIVFLVAGAVAGVRHTVVKIVHISGLAFAVLLQTAGWYCPLTYLEIRLRDMHNPELSYTGSFIIHYLERIVYPGVSPSHVFILTALLVVINVFIYIRTGKSR